MQNKNKIIPIVAAPIIALGAWLGIISAPQNPQIVPASPSPTADIVASVQPTLLDRMVVKNSPTPAPSPSSVPSKMPVPSKTPNQEPVASPTGTPAPSPSASSTPSPTPVMSPVPTPQAPTPTPTPMPEPTPTPAPIVKVTEVVFKSKNTVVNPDEVVLNVHTDRPGSVLVQFVVDDGSIMNRYNTGTKDNQELSDFVKQYAANQPVQTVESANGQFTGRQFPRGHMWFAVATMNEDGEVIKYLPNGNYYDWNNNFELFDVQ